MSIPTDKLLISSDFFSVQGEGISSGIPSYFVRLGVCNLSCGISRVMMNQIIKDKNLEDGEIFTGDLEANGSATWTCDSTSQWAWRGEDKSFQYLIDRWIEQSILEDIILGNIHIIWTGGEPTLPNHQLAIVGFLKYFKDFVRENYSELWWRFNPYHEIETNGTVVIEEPLFFLLSQINCSPKLSNSGMSEKLRIKPDALHTIQQHPNHQFKFVISTEEDILEMFEEFVIPIGMNLKKVVCMPGMDKQEDFHERTQFILEMAKKYKFRGLTRLHISAWNQVLNK